MRIIKAGLISAGIVCLSASITFAELQNSSLPYREGLKTKPLLIHGAFTQKEQVESNIYLDNTDRVTDLINISSPSVGLELPIYDHIISADYEVAEYLYTVNRLEDHFDQRARGLVELNFNNCAVKISDVYRIFTDRGSLENSVRVKEDTNNFRAGFSADFDRLAVDMGYNNKMQIYDSQQILYQQLNYHARSYVDQMLDLTVGYRIMPKTLLTFNDNMGYVRNFISSIPPNSFYNETFVGVTANWFRKIDFSVKAGPRFQTYSADRSTVISNKGYAGTVFNGTATYTPTDSDTVMFVMERTFRPSIFRNAAYYNANWASLIYTRQFDDKISGSLFCQYQLHLYPTQFLINGVTAKRRDDYLTSGASLRYDMKKWLSIELRYEYKQKQSEFNVFNYYDNVFSISGTVGF